MKFTSKSYPTFSIDASPEGNWDLNLGHALETERRTFKRSVPTGEYTGEDGRTVHVGWKNNCFQVNGADL